MFYDTPFDIAMERSYPTPFQNSTLLPLLLMSLATQKHTPDTQKFFKPQYDYIVVGAGTAGSIVAARLSEDPSKSVLLLEAGKSPPLITEVPAAQPYVLGSDLLWDYFTEPQKYSAFAHTGRRVPSGTGKTVGGSSSINGMLYLRGNRDDYNTWEKMGAHGWDWHGVFPYFLKPENNTDPDIAHNGFHGRRGPMSVGRFPSMSEFKKPLKNAVISMGHRHGDVNGARQSGFAVVQGNIRRGQRDSTAKAYLVPSEHRPNLDIVPEAYVTKVLITDKRAWGVQFDFEGSRYEVRAKSEVIVSAGAIKSPQVLMLSGIGPRKTLQKFDIPVIADLPVGKNFHDHVATMVYFYSTKNRPTILEKLQDPMNILKYINTRTGPLAVPQGIFGMGFIAENLTSQRFDLPEHQVFFYEAVFGKDPMYGLSQEAYDGLYGPYLNTPVITCLALNLIPKSRGYISIRSKDPYDPPVIDPNYYEIPQDVHHVVKAMKTCYEIMENPFMKELGFMPFETVMPGCEGLGDYDEYLECYARSFVEQTHVVGSVRMGDICDPETILDTYLRVKGIKGLRVIDASVMPKIVRGNTNNPVVMIAEKASDIMKGIR